MQVRQDRLDRALIAAIKRNATREVLSLLRQGADANCRDVPDLQGMTTALRAHVPGDTVEVEFKRNGQSQTVKVVLGRRGG